MLIADIIVTDNFMYVTYPCIGIRHHMDILCIRLSSEHNEPLSFACIFMRNKYMPNIIPAERYNKEQPPLSSSSIRESIHLHRWSPTAYIYRSEQSMEKHQNALNGVFGGPLRSLIDKKERHG